MADIVTLAKTITRDDINTVDLEAAEVHILVPHEGGEITISYTMRELVGTGKYTAARDTIIKALRAEGWTT